MTDAKPQRSAPWAVRGVSHESRDAASMASKRAGIPLGQWLDRVVMEAAMGELKSSARQEVGPTTADMLAGMVAQLEQINRRLDQVEHAKEPEPPPQPAMHRMGMGDRFRLLLTGKP